MASSRSLHEQTHLASFDVHVHLPLREQHPDALEVMRLHGNVQRRPSLLRARRESEAGVRCTNTSLTTTHLVSYVPHEEAGNAIVDGRGELLCVSIRGVAEDVVARLREREGY